MKRYLLVFFLIFFNIFGQYIEKNDSNEQYYIYSRSDTNYNESQKIIDIKDYVFIGNVINTIEINQYDGTGTDVPYTYFSVKALHKIKGSIDDDDDVVIKYYGGTDNNGFMHLIEGHEYPEPNDVYVFFVNLTQYNITDGRTRNGSYPVSDAYSMIKLSEYGSTYPLELQAITTKTQLWNQFVDSNLESYFWNNIVGNDFKYFIHDNNSGISNESLLGQSTSFGPPEQCTESNFDCGGSGPGMSGDSFDNAITLIQGESYEFYIGRGSKKYFKIKADTLNYIAAYTTGLTNTQVSVYDNQQTLIDVGYSPYEHERGTFYTNGENAFIHFYMEPNVFYYLVYEGEFAFIQGTSYAIYYPSNYLSTLYSNLSMIVDSVSNNQIKYTIESIYTNVINDALNEWGKLKTISFSIGNGNLFDDLVFKDINDADGPLARWIWVPFVRDIIEFNSYYYQNMSYYERLKTAMHEIGHSLGLNEFTGYENTTNVMVQGRREMSRLGHADIGVYKYKWDY